MVGAARTEADRLVSEATVEGNSLVEKARTDADELLVGARRDATPIRERAEELRDRIRVRSRNCTSGPAGSRPSTMKSAGDRCDALVKAAEEQLAKARGEGQGDASRRPTPRRARSVSPR